MLYCNEWWLPYIILYRWPLGDQLVTNWWPPFPSFSIIKSVSRPMELTPMFKSRHNIFRSKGSIKEGGRGMRGPLEWTRSTKSDNFCYLSFTHFTGLKSWTNIMSATSFFRKSAKLQPTRILIGKFHTVCVRWNHQNFIRVWGIWQLHVCFHLGTLTPFWGMNGNWNSILRKWILESRIQSKIQYELGNILKSFTNGKRPVKLSKE